MADRHDFDRDRDRTTERDYNNRDFDRERGRKSGGEFNQGYYGRESGWRGENADRDRNNEGRSMDRGSMLERQSGGGYWSRGNEPNREGGREGDHGNWNRGNDWNRENQWGRQQEDRGTEWGRGGRFDRENEHGGYSTGTDWNRGEYNHGDRGYNRGDYNREGSWNREGTWNREGSWDRGNEWNRAGSYGGQQRGGESDWNREGQRYEGQRHFEGESGNRGMGLGHPQQRHWDRGQNFGSNENLFGTGSRGFGTTWGSSAGYSGGQGSYSGGMGNYGEQGQYSGRGPKGYQRNDERIREDVCERLTHHPDIDASGIEVKVQNGEVVLSGNVDKRHLKRMAEDVAEGVSGVREVKNELRVEQHGVFSAGHSGTTTSTEQKK